ncbi:MAG TPA: GatB/YqeY domain-containing protein [Allosphingosinicella sp.]|nr:GatB/YqeY domain-containing protein [Allosphingosinicella sp.]
MIRDDIKQALVGAMKAGDTAKRDAIRLIQAALKNRDIELRGSANPPEDDVLVTEVLQKMVKQRRESIAMYEQGGRKELAEAEAAEVAVIETFLPRQLDDAELAAAVDAIVGETGAESVKDMGRVMALLRERHAGEVDMGKASGAVKARLSA